MTRNRTCLKRRSDLKISVGEVFTDWTIIEILPASYYPSGSPRPTRVLAGCRCGGQYVISAQTLRSGRSKRCNACRVAKARWGEEQRELESYVKAEKLHREGYGKYVLPDGSSVNLARVAEATGLSRQRIDQRYRRLITESLSHDQFVAELYTKKGEKPPGHWTRTRTGRPIDPTSARQKRLAKAKTVKRGPGRPIDPTSARQKRLAKAKTVKRRPKLSCLFCGRRLAERPQTRSEFFCTQRCGNHYAVRGLKVNQEVFTCRSSGSDGPKKSTC